MKKITLSFIILFVQLIAFGQTNEIEPNNSFGTASPLLMGDLTTATINATDTIDHHGLDFEYNANFYLVLHITNTASSGTGRLDLTIYNSLRVNDEYVGGFYPVGYMLDAGNSFYDTIIVCGLIRDSLYLQFKSNDQDQFEYTMEWYPVNAYEGDDLYHGYNNTPASATPFSFNIQKEGSIGYTFWGDNNFDTLDYFTTILPAANYDSVSLTISAQSNGCSGVHGMLYSCYKNGDPTPFASGYVGNNTAVNQYQTVFTSIPLNNMQQGDVLLVKYTATSPFGYRFKYSVIDEFEPDVEDNCCTYNAIPVFENHAFSGNVGEYDHNIDEFIDQFDTYRIILPQDGSINLIIKARNEECTEEYYALVADILDKYGNNLTGKELIYWDNFPTCGDVKTATIKLRAFSADTFYLSLYSGYNYGKISYNIQYQLADSTGSDPNDSYNDPITTILQVNAGEIKKGHVRFKKDAYLIDGSDIYKTTMPADGSITVYLKARFREDEQQFNSGTSKRLTFVTTNFTGRTPLNPPVTFIDPDQVYLDTFHICGLGAGDLYFTLSSPLAYEYEFRYEITDTSSTDNDVEPNNSFAQATAVGGGVTKMGHINYVSNVSPDTYDYYKMIYDKSDSLIIPLQATNTSCLTNRTISFNGYNKNQSLIFSKIKNNVAPGQTVYDTVKIAVAAPDTIYLLSTATGSFKYQFSTNPTFYLDGDTSVCYGTEIYTARNIGSTIVTYNWSLPLGGGSLTFADSVATVTWNASGNRKVQLYLSNGSVNSQAKQLNVVVNGVAPTQVPVAYNFARTLSTNSLPPGAHCQWYKDNILIAGATDSVYYAALAGSFTVKFINNCGTGPASNAIVFTAAAQAQTITFPHVSTQSMSPVAKVVLQATASSGLPVFYQKISGQANIVNDTLFITGAGTIIVKAVQPGDDVYSAAPVKYDTITVIKGNQVITFNSVPDQILDANTITLSGTSSVGEYVYYTITSGNAYALAYGGAIYKTGTGLVTVRASQPGNANYNPATPVDRTFCIGIRTLTPITGEASPCLATYRYNTQKIPGANYIWTLSSGGILTTNSDTAWVQWQTPGNHTLTVKANGTCDPVFTNLQSFAIATSSNQPGIVSNMLPANNAIDQQLPLTLSWVPGNNTVNYDLYLWDSTATEPATPYVANISGIQYIIPKNPGLPYNRTYKWKIVAKNPCSQTAGPIQKFRLIPLPDLVASDVQAPSTATSGQTITISWKVTNIGPGRTNTNEMWYDGVYLALDTIPNVDFHASSSWDPYTWNALTANGRPLLIASKPRPASLDSGQFYTNTVDFTLPLNYSFPVYVYVIAANNHPNYPLLQASVLNDTARKQNPVIISLAPTPDLRVDSVFAPASIFSGSTVNLTYKVKNYGVVTPAGASWNDAIYMSQNSLFDSSTAIRIKGVKSNASYYPNAPNAGTTVNTQLLPDSIYTRNVQVVVPNFIFGTWFFYVKANDNKILYEGALSNNNINQAQVQVYLTPTPKLTVDTVTLPITSAGTTQPVGANWLIKNEGFRDNIEKNRGHYFTNSICIVPCPPGPPGPPGSTPAPCYAPSITADSIVFGSSYWLDRVYLSTDPNGLNIANATLVKEITHGIQNSGLYSDRYPDFIHCPADFSNINPQVINGRYINIADVIQPGASFPKLTNFTIPDSLQPGNYYVYVFTNPTKTVFEYPGTPQIKRSALPIAVVRPDVVVPSVTVPASVSGGQQFSINYNVLNNGAGAVFNHIRRDRIYVSNFSSFDGSAQLIDTKIYTEDLPVGTAVPHTLTYALPAATSGNKYFYVLANYDSAFRETNSQNNLSAAAMTSVTTALPADLVVSNIQMPDTTFTIFDQYLTYTVTNNGTGTTAGSWIDSVYFSCSSTFNFSTNNFMARKGQTRSIPPGGNYTDTIHFAIPRMSYEINPCFPETANQSAYFYIKTNAGLTIYEGSNINNNVAGSGSKPFTNPLVDQIVTTVSGADTTSVGFAYPVNWRIKNIGYNPNYSYYYLWADAIYFSTDSIADASDVLAGDYLKYLRLNRNQDSADSKSPYTPNLLTGDYYVYVKTNSRNSIPGEKVLSNNVNFIRNTSGAAKKIHVIRPNLPDLVDSIISAPASIAAGQPVTIIYKVTNTGPGVTYPGTSFVNSVLLSDDIFANPNDGDRLLATRYRNSVLLPGQSYYDTLTATIPIYTAPGNYFVISKANSYNTVVESNINNNLGLSVLNVFTPPVSDLIVTNVTKPDTVYLGYTIDTAKWITTNNSGEVARGYMADGIYLSAGNLFDSTAMLMGIKNKNINLQPLQSDTVSLAPLVTGVVEGNYNVFVKTDLLNNILESNKDNNVGMSPTPIYVKVKELLLNIPETNTLQTVNRYYKLRIPDFLYGSTILVTLKTNDSLIVRNEMFIGGGYTPTAAHYNYRFEIANYGNQQIVMTDVTDSVYYIMYRCVSPNPVVQNVTLKAVKLPFAILNVHTNAGGNIGNVTIKISGSLFRDSMIAKLSKPGTTIYASAVYFTNSTQVFASFNLQGKPLGIYDVILTKPDSSTAVLQNGFSIVPANNGGLITGGGVNTGAGNGNAPGCDPGAASGLNSQLVVDLIVPDRALVNRPVVILVNYSNPTNYDIPAQSRILYSEAGMKMAFTKEGVPFGTTSLYLELVEPGGPPGIIRAGGSGTIIIHTKAPAEQPQPIPIVLFKLK